MNQTNTRFQNLRAIALDMDGVAMTDTFSPVIHRFVETYGGTYSAEIERNVFSRPREEAASFLKRTLQLEMTEQEVIQAYFDMRKKYIVDHPYEPVSELADFLKRMKSLGLPVLCYGGLPESFFDDHLSAYREYFVSPYYISTNDFRPGIKEIVQDVLQLDYSRVVFLDDVNTVAEEAKRLGVPFIGVPSSYPYGFQKSDMQKTGVEFLVSSVGEVTEELLDQLDHRISQGEYLV